MKQYGIELSRGWIYASHYPSPEYAKRQADLITRKLGLELEFIIDLETKEKYYERKVKRKISDYEARSDKSLGSDIDKS